MKHKFIKICCLSCGNIFDVPVYCGDRFCPICSIARRMRVRQRLYFLIDNVKRTPGYGFKHLSLTIKNQQNLTLMTSSIVQSFRKLRQTPTWKAHVRGGAFVIEVTGKPLDWHVHLHICMMSKYFLFDTLLALWMKLSTGRGVWINDIPKDQVVHYLTKYLSKTDVSPDFHDDLNKALKNTRLFQPFGDWYAINRLYVKPEPHCKDCNKPCFCVYANLLEDQDFTFNKAV